MFDNSSQPLSASAHIDYEPPRRDGHCFDLSYLLTPNPAVAEAIRWPVPVLWQQAAMTEVSIGQVTVSPGDVLEALTPLYEDFILIVAELPVPASTTAGQLGDTAPQNGFDGHRLLCYSTTFEAYRVYKTDTFSLFTLDGWFDSILYEIQESDISKEELEAAAAPVPVVNHPTETFAVHHDAATPVADDPVATTSTSPETPVVGVDTTAPGRHYPYAESSRVVTPDPPRSASETDIDIPAAATPSDVVNTFYTGDATAVLSNLPDNTIHTWITSPPYPGAQRDYSHPEQLGDESPAEYLERLLAVVQQVMRVTHDSGTGFIVIDDAVVNGEYLTIPDRLVTRLKSLGYHVFNNSPWVKTQTTPDPSHSRFNHRHERIIGIAHDSNYYFDRHAPDDIHDVVETTTGATPADVGVDADNLPDVTHDAVFPVDIPRKLIAAAAPDAVCPTCNTPLNPSYKVTDIRDLPTDRPQCQNALKHARRAELSDDHLWALRSYGLASHSQTARTQNGTDRNATDVEQLVAEVEASSFPNSYMSEFLYAKKSVVRYNAQCSCSQASTASPADTAGSPAGVVCDPFVGTGITTATAVLMNKRYLGVDINPEYTAYAEALTTAATPPAPWNTEPGDEQSTLSTF